MTSLSSTINSIIVGSSITEAIELLIEGRIKDQIDVIERLMKLFKKRTEKVVKASASPAPARAVKSRYTMVAKYSSRCKDCGKSIKPGDTIVRASHIRWVCKACGVGTSTPTPAPPPPVTGFSSLLSSSAKKAVDDLDVQAGTIISRLAMGGVNPRALKNFVDEIEKVKKLHFSIDTTLSAGVEDLKKLLL